LTPVDDHIKRVNSKLQQLLKQYLLIQNENEKLKEKLTELRLSKENETAEVDRLQQQVSILKSSMGQMEEPDKKVFEKQINKYIKEIDKCIGLLSE